MVNRRFENIFSDQKISLDLKESENITLTNQLHELQKELETNKQTLADEEHKMKN